MVRRRLLLPLLLLLTAAAPGSSDTIRAPMLMRHIAVLASDDYGGRAPGSEGGRKTEHYIVAQFGAAGLQPGAPAGNWFQRVETGGPGIVDRVAAAVSGTADADHADNIIGKVAGSDPSKGAVLITAHWDHLGYCRTLAADRICNGAIDNASGVALLIEIARAVAAGPRPVRDVYFVATTGEEEGELGAKAFVAQPPVPLATIVAAFNLDTMAIAPAGTPVAIIGRGLTDLDPLIFAVARAQHRAVDKDNAANRYLDRQDGWPLLRHHVPAVMVGSAFSNIPLLEAFLQGRYHTPADDLAHPIELGGATEDANLHVALVRAFADPSRFRPKPRNRDARSL